MNPDVCRAIPELVQRGILPADKASYLLRIARRELVSVYLELRFLLYVGVLLVTSGIGLLVKENLERIGPLTIALAIGLAAGGALAWVARTSPAFSWQEVPSPNLAFDYILLLGVLLGAADLAYIEVQFTPLGENWPWHLLFVSLLTAALAVRFDSRLVFSLALTTFASWRGVSVSLLSSAFWSDTANAVRANTLGCGLLFVFLGALLTGSRRKPHFEPVAAHLGWLLMLGSLASGMFDSGFEPMLFAVALLLSSVGLAFYAYLQRRSRKPNESSRCATQRAPGRMPEPLTIPRWQPLKRSTRTIASGSGLSSASFFFYFTRLQGGRILWIAVPLLFLPFLTRGSESSRLTPSHRQACSAALVVALLALYVAIHTGSFDTGLLEKGFIGMGRNITSWDLSPVRWLFIVATAIVPVALLAAGIRTRRRLLLNMGLLLGIVSLVTLRYYVHLGPLWVVLTVAGAAAIVGVLLVRRRLYRAPNKEHGGFTAEPFFEDLARRNLLEMGATITTLYPRPSRRVKNRSLRAAVGLRAAAAPPAPFELGCASCPCLSCRIHSFPGFFRVAQVLLDFYLNRRVS